MAARSAGEVLMPWNPSPFLSCPAVRGPARAADPDRDVVGRLGLQLEVGEPVVVAGERGGVAAPDETEDVQRLVHTRSPIGERLVERLELGLRPAHARRHGQPAIAQTIEAGQSVGQLQWVILRDDQHAGAEPDSLGRCRSPSEGQQRLEQVRRRIALIGRHHDVIGHPDVAESELLGPHGGPPNRIGDAARPYCGRCIPSFTRSSCRRRGLRPCGIVCGCRAFRRVFRCDARTRSPARSSSIAATPEAPPSPCLEASRPDRQTRIRLSVTTTTLYAFVSSSTNTVTRSQY